VYLATADVIPLGLVTVAVLSAASFGLSVYQFVKTRAKEKVSVNVSEVVQSQPELQPQSQSKPKMLPPAVQPQLNPSPSGRHFSPRCSVCKREVVRFFLEGSDVVCANCNPKKFQALLAEAQDRLKDKE